VKSNENGAPPTGAGGWKPSPAAVAARPAPAVPPPSSVKPPTVPRDRKPALAALGLLLAVVGALASVYLQQRAGDKVGVVEIAKRVPQGQTVTSDDISEVMVSVDSSISYVTWAQAQAGALRNYTARTDLVPGTVLVGQMLTGAAPLSQGSQIIGISLKDGQYPAGIQPGDVVSLYYVSNHNDDKTGQQFLTNIANAAPLVTGVKIYDIGAVNPSGNLDLSLVLSQADAAAVVQAASGGNLILTLEKHTQ